MTKNVERDRARQLRQEEGLSIIEIAEKIGVSKGSVSVWVRDIILSPEHEEALRWNNKRVDAQRAGSQANVIKHRVLRQQYQQEGRAKAREGNLLHLQGCMLHWAEGTKARSELKFANSDPEMLQVFIKFLREGMCIQEEKITFRVHCYTGNGLLLEEIEDYWLTLLSLRRYQIRKSIVNNQPISSQQKGRKLIYGVGHLSVNGTRYIQHVYGAIQEYTGINKPEWLDIIG
jgi:transcriptional regulator with XRE-family HTH domain